MARVNLYEELYDKVIDDRGNRCLWESACVCSCVSRDTGQPDFSCELCGGSGYVYLPPKEILVVITSINSDFQLKTLELREPGTAYCTPKSDIIMGYKDRLRFPDFQCKFSEVIHWEKGNLVSPKTYRNIIKPIYLADKKFEYELGVDFEVAEDGHHLRWINKAHFKQVHNLGFLYLTTPSYLVTDLLHELRATLSDRKPDGGEGTGGKITFRELPKQYRLQREDFFYHVNEIEEPSPNDMEDGTHMEDVNTEEPGEVWDDDGVVI